jgi:hypothetical protein
MTVQKQYFSSSKDFQAQRGCSNSKSGTSVFLPECHQTWKSYFRQRSESSGRFWRKYYETVLWLFPFSETIFERGRQCPNLIRKRWSN